MSKYHNKKTEYEGVVYDSKKEAEFARTLDILRKAKKDRERVVAWQRQVPFDVKIRGTKVCSYKADFLVTYADGRDEIIDVKGYRTALYRLKKKLVEAQYMVKIIEV